MTQASSQNNFSQSSTMCLAVIAVDWMEDWPLILVANRDEFHERPTTPLGPWLDKDGAILAGRDLRASGTWLGTNMHGRVALLTNFREPGRNNPEAVSRGQLVEQYLTESKSTQSYIQSVHKGMQDYNGFNLILSDNNQVWFMSNRGLSAEDAASESDEPNAPLPAGVYGLSNASLDTPWPKLTRSRDSVRTHLDTKDAPSAEVLFEIFADRTQPSDAELPRTGLPLDRERLLSSPFIVDPVYGTRSTSIVLKHRSGRLRFCERSFNMKGQLFDQQDWSIDPLIIPARARQNSVKS